MGFGFVGDGAGLGAGAGRATTGARGVACWTTRTVARGATRCLTTGRLGRVRCRGEMWTTGGVGTGATARGAAALRCSAGEADSNAARQRYPEVTPATTSRQSRSASNEIRTRKVSAFYATA